SRHLRPPARPHRPAGQRAVRSFGRAARQSRAPHPPGAPPRGDDRGRSSARRGLRDALDRRRHRDRPLPGALAQGRVGARRGRELESFGMARLRLYEPIAQAALDAGLPIVATNLSRVATDAIRRNGLAGLSASLARQLGLEEPLDPETRDAIRRELDASHCGTVEGATLEPMVDVQWARDARMAEALVRAGQRDGAILIAGAGHVRTDRGVPFPLPR